MLLFGCNYAKSIQAQENKSEKEMICMIKNFYTAYITENSKMPIDTLQIDALKKKHCTTSLLLKLENEDLDYDPFLNAQDCDINMLQSLNIKKAQVATDVYIISYLAEGHEDPVVIKMKVTKKGDAWMIDEIL